MILNRIKNALQSICAENNITGVTYGQKRQHMNERWNYFIFQRGTIEQKNHGDFVTTYLVSIVCENYIPEGLEATVRAALKSDSEGILLVPTKDDIQYEYIFKGQSDIVVEICTMAMYHPEKRI